MEREALLPVALDVVGHELGGAGRQIQHFEAGLRANAARVGERLAIGRGRRGRGAPPKIGERLDLPRAAVEPLDLPDPFVDIAAVAEARVARREVKKPPVGGKSGIGRVGLLVFLGELHPLAPLHVPKPQFHGSQRRGVGQALPPNEVVAVGGPGRGAHGARALGAHRAGVLPLEITNPKILEAAAVAREGDRAPVGAEAGLHVVGGARGDSFGLAAVDRQQIEIPKDRHHQLCAVGVDVEVEPGRLVGGERDGAARPVGIVDAPGGLPLGGRLGCLGSLGSLKKCGKEREEDGPCHRAQNTRRPPPRTSLDAAPTFSWLCPATSNDPRAPRGSAEWVCRRGRRARRRGPPS